MSKKKQPAKKLVLHRETVRNLSSADLSRVGGGLLGLTSPTKDCPSANGTCSIFTGNHNETLLRARRK